MFSAAIIAVLSIGLVGLGYWCKKLLAKVARLEMENEVLRVQQKVVKKQNDIAAGAHLDADALLKLMRSGAL